MFNVSYMWKVRTKKIALGPHSRYLMKLWKLAGPVQPTWDLQVQAAPDSLEYGSITLVAYHAQTLQVGMLNGSFLLIFQGFIP
jgi:hypothetical protein